MSNRKVPERRISAVNRQSGNPDHNDLSMAITELHQTIVRLNKVIDQVKHEPTGTTAKRQVSQTTKSQANEVNPELPEELCLATLIIPKILH